MKIEVTHSCPDYSSYRAACVKSLFNVDAGNSFSLMADLPIEEDDWQVSLVIGPSGSGKSSIGNALSAEGFTMHQERAWPDHAPIIDVIAPDGDWQAVTGALSAVGLGDVPAWLRPYRVLSTGEKFRAELARIVSEKPERIVIDEFTSVVDRQIAKVGAHAFAKAWRRTSGKAVLLSCHYDIVEWVQPDWVFDTATGKLSRRCLQRPPIELEIRQKGWEWWEHFAPHHYLKLPHMIAATCYVGFVNGEPVAHLAVSTRSRNEARACRLVVMPEWQGAGVGLRFLNAVCDMWRRGENRYERPMPVLFHTSHPGLAAALRRQTKWCQVSAKLYGANKARCARSLAKSAERRGKKKTAMSGYGGHFRAVQGFRYMGDIPCE
ncbi:GNAT family N-acetyltransferase [Halodesulfovibrio aestuarii]|uniref:GNAT family N-acetyltransferase n=1 Tax=Halodesulfovibrio aestuarii TaxID=126333 RepID=UPI003D32A2D2